MEPLHVAKSVDHLYWGPIGMVPKRIEKNQRFADDVGNVWRAGENIPAGSLVVVEIATNLILRYSWERIGQTTKERPW